MAKKPKYAIDPAFQHFPVMPFPMGRISAPLVNAFLRFDVWFQQRKTKAKAALHTITVRDGHAMEVFQFRPDNAKPGDALPAVVYYHGGGFALTYASTHIAAMDAYANAAGCNVFLVDYRLMPRHVFPTGFNDCCDALSWVSANAASLGVNAARVVLMGDSAGGGITASVTQWAHDNKGPAVAGQLMIYPTMDHTCSSESAKNFPDTPLWNSVGNKKMWGLYLSEVDANNPPPYASAGTRADLSGLPPAYVDNAEFDPLRDEGADYARRLKAAGVPVELHEPKGTMHGYDTVLTSPITQDSVARRVAFLKKIFA
ncbi:MAG TPA: alpha/beta hydrolase [Pseudomonadales bacterium]